MMGLTEKQAETRDFIAAELRAKGRPPSYAEICAALGFASKSNVHRLVLALEERGAIRRLPHRSRAIEVVEPAAAPAGLAAAVARLDAPALRNHLALTIALLAQLEGGPRVAALCHRLGDQLPGAAS